jgi:lipopolysaccharide/colanic/teichoic acid biosynthesis glycosyltransferase
MSYRLKHTFDLSASFFGLITTWWIIILAWIIASIETKSNGFFIQKRVGRSGKLFYVIKIKTMQSVAGIDTTITTSNDKRITKSGMFFRKTKIDELPQLWNVFKGEMSFVGPRPDIPGYADKLKGEDRFILDLKPGITGPASLKYANEEELLSMVDNPKKYNDQIIFPDKVKINLEYYYNNSFFGDLKLIFRTIYRSN